MRTDELRNERIEDLGREIDENNAIRQKMHVLASSGLITFDEYNVLLANLEAFIQPSLNELRALCDENARIHDRNPASLD